MSQVFDNGYALVVGVGGALPGSAADARAVAAALVDPERCAYPPSHVTLLTDAQASRVGILAALDGLAARAGEGATVFVFFSGYGYRATTAIGEAYYLIPSGAQIGQLVRTAIGDAELLDALEAIGAARLMLVLDCCHEGDFVPPEQAAAIGLELVKSPPPAELQDRFGEAWGLLISARAGETSGGGAPTGAFARALIEALSGKGATKRDGLVYASELAAYVARVVAQRTKRRQRPLALVAGGDRDFALAYYAGGAREPREPGKQAIGAPPAPAPQGSQTTIGGDVVGPALTGVFNDAVTIGDSVVVQGGAYQPGWQVAGSVVQLIDGRPIDWASVDDAIARSLADARSRFVQHMADFAGARPGDERDALSRFVPLRLQESLDAERGEREGRAASASRAEWQPMVGAIDLLLGATGSGKTTQLLYTLRVMAERAQEDPTAPIPIYVSLRALGGDVGDLLEVASAASGIPANALRELWVARRRPICLLLNDADDLSEPNRDRLVAAVAGLWRASPGHHRVALASRPGLLREQLDANQLPVRELLVMPLNDADINTLLTRYGAQELIPALDANLRAVIQTPDLLSALAQIRRRAPTRVPTSAGKIYELLIELLIKPQRERVAEDYDYAVVKRPVLARLAIEMLRADRSYVPCDDALYDQIALELERIEKRYGRRREVLPAHWSAQRLIEELAESPLIERSDDGNGEERLVFRKSGYQDYFAAVYMASASFSPADLQQLVEKVGYRRMMQPLILMIGINPASAALIDNISQSDPQLVARFWFEIRPGGVAAPRAVLDLYEQRAAALAAAPLAGWHEPLTLRLLAGMLNSAETPERLRATRALTQWGTAAIDLLLQAAQDPQPIVRAVAIYALQHMGEPAPEGGLNRPLPPLIDVQGQAFSFQSHGGCNAWIGGLRLVDVPDPVHIHLSLRIDQLDFDPFAVDSSFHLTPVPPALLAAQIYELREQMDWVDLTARCRQIAEISALIAARAEQSMALQIVASMQQRALRYDALGRLLAADLGVPWGPIGGLPATPEPLALEMRDTYARLRRLFTGTNQPAIRRLADQAKELPSERQVALGAVTDGSTVLGMTVSDDVRLDQDRGVAEVGESVVVPLRLAPQLTASALVSSNLMALTLDSLLAVPQLIPRLMRLGGTIGIERVSDAHIGGLLIRHMRGGPHGWAARLSISIGAWAASTLDGVVVAAYEPAQPAALLDTGAALQEPMVRIGASPLG